MPKLPRKEGTKPQASVILSLSGVSYRCRYLGSTQVLPELDLNSTAIRGIIESCFLKQLGCQQWGNVQDAGGVRATAIFEQIITFVENVRLNLGIPTHASLRYTCLLFNGNYVRFKFSRNEKMNNAQTSPLRDRLYSKRNVFKAHIKLSSNILHHYYNYNRLIFFHL